MNHTSGGNDVELVSAIDANLRRLRELETQLEKNRTDSDWTRFSIGKKSIFKFGTYEINSLIDHGIVEGTLLAEVWELRRALIQQIGEIEDPDMKARKVAEFLDVMASRAETGPATAN